VKNKPKSLAEDSFSMFCKVYGNYVDRDNLKLGIYSFFKNISPISRTHQSTETFKWEKRCSERRISTIKSDHETEVEIEPRKSLNLESM